MTRLAVLAAAIISLVALTASVSVTSAQYPPPDDAVAIFVSDSTPPTGSFVSLSFFLQDLDGPSGIFPGSRGCRASIAEQPGSDAFLFQFPGGFFLGGMALLYVGSTPGPLVVEVNCPRGTSGQVTLMVT